MRERLGNRDRWLAAAAAALLAACGDTLVDHDGGDLLLPPGGSQCGAGQVACLVGGASTCVAEDADHCGSQCAVCPAAPANAFRVCAGGGCDFECSPGLLRCGSGCCTAASVALGAAHTCAVTSGGGVRCWGSNDAGQLGAGLAAAQSPLPVDVAGLSGVIAVSAGSQHTCAVAAGAVHCWGANAFGQLGDGTSTDRGTPVAVAGLAGVTAVAAGTRHTCALTSGGAVHCWGDNASGQLGTGGTPLQSSTPVAIPPANLSGATAVAAGGFHACALTGGTARCWGANANGQVGKGALSTAEPSPIAIAGALPGSVLAVAAGAGHTVAAVGPAGSESLWGWGNDTQMQLGIKTLGTYPTPTQEDNVSTKPAAVAAGRAHSCALKADVAGALKCFGENAVGQLGTALATDKNDVAFAGATAGPVKVAAGGDHSCAILGDGTLWCWGANGRGQVGDGSVSAFRPDPTRVSGR